MGLLTRVEVRNFKCFRDWVAVDLGQSTFLAGANNSGKTALLAAVDCFFDSTRFSVGFINKTELAAKKEGFNRAEVRVTFDLNQVTGRVRKDRIQSAYGQSLCVGKSFTWREASSTLTIEYHVPSSSKGCSYEELDEDVKHLIGSVSVSYIHPQEGVELLRRAQDKFKQRLFHNWGRHASVAERVNEVQERWEALRETANSYLSSALSAKVREIWPGAEVKVDLPDRIQDIVAVSDITFRSSPSLPQITLPSHGTGAQSTILYQTHYVLDSDRSLHQGMYFPVWLLEEPESFLHADIAVQLARLLSSDEWLNSIQMLISTHSPIMLAGSRQAEERSRWAIMKDHLVSWQKPVTDVTSADIESVGRLMGDSNFGVYFDASSRSPRVFLEDSRACTKTCFERAGVHVTASLGGITRVKQYLDVIVALGEPLSGQTYFVVDSDDGLKELERFTTGKKDSDKSTWGCIEVARGVFVVRLPLGSAVEDLFSEWSSIMDEAIGDVYDDNFKLRDVSPTHLSRLVSELRAKQPKDRGAARALARKHQDVKELFWRRAEKEAWVFEQSHVDALRRFLPPAGRNPESPANKA